MTIIKKSAEYVGDWEGTEYDLGFTSWPNCHLFALVIENPKKIYIANEKEFKKTGGAFKDAKVAMNFLFEEMLSEEHFGVPQAYKKGRATYIEQNELPLSLELIRDFYKRNNEFYGLVKNTGGRPLPAYYHKLPFKPSEESIFVEVDFDYYDKDAILEEIVYETMEKGSLIKVGKYKGHLFEEIHKISDELFFTFKRDKLIIKRLVGEKETDNKICNTYISSAKNLEKFLEHAQKEWKKPKGSKWKYVKFKNVEDAGKALKIIFQERSPFAPVAPHTYCITEEILKKIEGVADFDLLDVRPISEAPDRSRLVRVTDELSIARLKRKKFCKKR